MLNTLQKAQIEWSKEKVVLNSGTDWGGFERLARVIKREHSSMTNYSQIDTSVSMTLLTPRHTFTPARSKSTPTVAKERIVKP